MSPHRTDARRNREKILRVADEAFAQGSEVVSLEEIARRVRLGRATVYRHFPDRRALGLAVATQQLRMLRRILKQEETERRSFRDLLAMVLASQVSKRPLVRLFRELPVRYQERYADELVAVLTPAFRRAQADGQLREDVEPTDLLLVFEMIESAIAAGTARAHPGDPTQRIITVILDGFVAEPAPLSPGCCTTAPASRPTPS
ncbi:TetR/AcrR family transcriptional regulator [Streptomyces sp. NPDC002896]|uniref:TetR/AcrR family transcriptional regulator n=1 Tax=Streptomyces sp. NPDC002896 TaxID=3154438 RepID=UPI00332D5D8C